jgi:Subtilase family
VTVIDSGIAVGNAEFAGRIHAASADLAGSRGLQDEGGHGTAVSSVLLGAKDDVGTQGIAFGATLLVARTDTPGSCGTTGTNGGCTHNDNAIARGVDLAVANSSRVVNISLGGSPANSTLRNAINRATAAGVIIIISAGNEGVTDPLAAVDPDPLAQVANDPVARGLVIIAGALDSTNTALRDFSNKAGNGAAHYIGALGSRVRAIDQTGTTFLYSGTSFSAPVVAGAVALIAQAFPTLTGTQIVDLLLRTADDLGATGVDAIFGVGALNLTKAFAPQGSLALAGSAIPLGTSTGTTSTAMGDASQSGLSAVVLDDYGRAFALDIGGRVQSSPQSQKLASALGIDSQTRAIGTGAAVVSLSIAPGRDDVAVNRLLLSGQDQIRARAIAGSVVMRLGRDSNIAFGVSTSGIALANQFSGRMSPNFLLGGEAGRSSGFAAQPEAALAFTHSFSGFNLSASAETGTAQLWQSRSGDALRSGYHGYGYGQYAVSLDRQFGALNLGARATQLVERETILGAHFDGLFGTTGARTWFADMEARWVPLRNWSLDMAYRRGWTRAGAGGLRAGNDLLQSDAWSIGIAHAGLFDRHDRAGVRISQPLRVSSGGFNLLLPTGYDYATLGTTYSSARFNLSPTGREIDFEAAYSRAFGGGSLSSNLFYRRDPGNVASAPDDVGAAIRMTFGL